MLSDHMEKQKIFLVFQMARLESREEKNKQTAIIVRRETEDYVNIGITAHIFRWSVLEDIHSVALKNEKKKEFKTRLFSHLSKIGQSQCPNIGLPVSEWQK